MRYVVAGGSGFLGQALRAELSGSGAEVVRLVRRQARASDESSWDPYAGRVDRAVLAAADVVVSLSGASVARPWTAAYRRTLLASRTATAGTLATALAGLDDPPVLVAQSAVGYYGRDRGDAVLTEDAGAGDGLLADVVGAWERATAPAEEAGVRVVRLRCGVVLDRGGGLFPLLSLPFRLGLGGRLGSGRQYVPAVSRHDWARAVRFVAEHADCRDAYNLALPEPPTNAELTETLGELLHRPTPLPVPAAVLRRLLGELSWQVLGSLRVVPDRLLRSGFDFTSRDVRALVAAALHRPPAT